MHLEQDQQLRSLNKPEVLFSATSRLLGRSATHNGSFEYFQPFGGVMVTNALFAPSNVLGNVAEMYGALVKVQQIVVATSFNGQIKVFYQLK